MKVDWTLMAKVFSGEANEKEIQIFENWSQSNIENKQMTAMLKKNWDSVNPEDKKIRVDVDQAWMNVRNRLEEEQLIPEKLTIPRKQFVLSPALRVAAAAVLLVGLSILSYLLFVPAGRSVQMTARTQELQEFGIILPDGSRVDLNANSKLEYKLQKSGIRMVSLEGDAFFNVTHDEYQPFIIKAGNGIVQVTGTSFSVRTIPEVDRIEVYVESGNVQFYRSRKQDKVLSLNKGQMGVLEQNRLSRNSSVEPNHLAWKTRKLTFRETRLGDVAGVLNRTYSQNIRFNNEALEDCLFTGTFDKQPVDSVVRVIQIAFDLDLNRDGKAYVFSGNGCN
ncbi:FecR family protein [Bacteroidota bacterium]